MIVLRTVGPSILAFCLAACSSSSSPAASDDAGESPDSSHTPGDAGASPDAAATSGDASPGDASATSDSGSVPPNDARLVLEIPATFTGVTRELDVIVTSSVPVAGPPAGILYQKENPTLTPGEALTIDGDATGIDGSYYVVVVLYMQGGGQFTPTSGVDYETQSTSKVTFSGAATDLGTLTLALAH